MTSMKEKIYIKNEDIGEKIMLELNATLRFLC